GVEPVRRDADLEPAVLLERLVDGGDEVRLVVDEQHLALAALQGVGRDAVVLHELVEGLAGDAPELRARHPEALELPVVEAADDGLLGDLADFGGLAGREHGLHAYATLPARPAREKEVRAAVRPSRRDRNPSVN